MLSTSYSEFVGWPRLVIAFGPVALRVELAESSSSRVVFRISASLAEEPGPERARYFVPATSSAKRLVRRLVETELRRLWPSEGGDPPIAAAELLLATLAAFVDGALVSLEVSTHIEEAERRRALVARATASPEPAPF